MNRLHICTENILEKASMDREAGVIKDICVMRSLSLNGRRYLKQAMESAANKVGKSFWNHETAGMGGIFGSGARDVRDMIGKLSNGRQEGDAVFADLHIRKKWRDEVFEIAEEYPETCGFSIVARGKYADEKDSDGYDVVEDIEHLYSVDLVDNPATTHSMFESLCKKADEDEQKTISFSSSYTYDANTDTWTSGEGTATDPDSQIKYYVQVEPQTTPVVKTKPETSEGGERDMFDKVVEILEPHFPKKEMKGITEAQAEDKLKDLVSSLVSTSEEAKEENARLSDELKVTTEALNTAEKERDELKVKVEAFETKERKEKELQEKLEAISAIIEEVGLKEEDISGEMHTILLKLEEAEIRSMLEAFKDTVGGVHSSGKEQKMDVEDKGEKKEEIDVDKFIERYASKQWLVT